LKKKEEENEYELECEVLDKKESKENVNEITQKNIENIEKKHLNTERKRKRRCSQCQKEGHDKRSCLNK
jgi:hypothetical protein